MIQKQKLWPQYQDFCKAVMSQPYRHATSMRVANTPAELMWKHGGWCLLRPVRADQSEQTRRVHAHSFIKKKTWLPILHMFAWKFAALCFVYIQLFLAKWMRLFAPSFTKPSPPWLVSSYRPEQAPAAMFPHQLCQVFLQPRPCWRRGCMVTT